MTRSASLALTFALTLTFTAAAHAASVFGDAATFQGDRSVGDGLKLGSDSDSDWETGSVHWNITPSGSLFQYEYTFKNFTGHDISHIAMNLSKDALDGQGLDDGQAVQNITVSAGSVSTAYNDGVFKNEPGIDGGVKFETDDSGSTESDFVLSFLSNRSPVWGHIVIEQGQGKQCGKREQDKKFGPPFGKRGGPSFDGIPGNSPYNMVANNAYLSEDNEVIGDSDNFIARPNGMSTAVPTPSAAGAGLLLLTGMLMRRNRRRHTPDRA